MPDGADPAQAKRDVMEAVRAHFRPEFLNRLDETIIFDRLSRADMDGIVEIQLGPAAESVWRRATSRWIWIRARNPGWPMKAMTRSTVRAR